MTHFGNDEGNEKNCSLNSKDYEENPYGLDLDLLFI